MYTKPSSSITAFDYLVMMGNDLADFPGLRGELLDSVLLPLSSVDYVYIE